MRLVVRVEPDGAGSGSVALTTATGEPLTAVPRAVELLTMGSPPNERVWALRPADVDPAAPYADLAGADHAGLRALLDAAKARTIDAAGLVAYGRLLFDAVIGPDAWSTVVADLPAGDHHVELAIRLAAPLDVLHDLHWELLHDGSRFLGLGCGPCVSIVRLVPTPPGRPAPATLDRLPRVLFAIGARLTDPEVRPGAEFMGVLRRLEREGGAIQPSVLTEATRTTITERVAAFAPDIVHLIGHGRLDPLSKQGQLELRPDPGEQETRVWTSASDLAATLGDPPMPRAVVLSACDTGRVGAPGSPSIASVLVTKGVPVVAAMAGEVADKSCRLFTRAVAAAVVSGKPVSVAAAIGRRAAYADSTGVASIDWSLPVLYLAESVPAGYVLADPAPLCVVRERISGLDLVRAPVFCGRQEFFGHFDQLIDAERSLAVLGAVLTGEAENIGSTRLLRELGASAVRSGHVPVLVGPFELSDDDRPTDRAGFVRAVDRAVRVVRKKLALTLPPSSAAAALAADPGIGRDELVDHLRADLFALAADASALPMTAPAPLPVVLLAGIHRWDKALPDVLAALDTTGFGSGAEKLPVVFTGAILGDVGSELRTAWEQYKGDTDWKRFLPLDRWRQPEDELAYQWLFLNPASFGPGPAPPVYTVRRSVNSDWVESCRDYMRGRPMFDESLYSWAKSTGVPAQWLEPNNDEDVLQHYPELSA